jgi:hypothetical protein
MMFFLNFSLGVMLEMHLPTEMPHLHDLVPFYTLFFMSQLILGLIVLLIFEFIHHLLTIKKSKKKSTLMS